eukprot:TRINITY_DN6557_c0_g3_i1.p1 TRINITY_DN6557_c0_g3~~TRINITY_DN6557_c0_g3_i1.p1  ORF type:complete len:273 (+),score=37.15 TRINITY_DN6557_c0_g3_i1:291-1109(+)
MSTSVEQGDEWDWAIFVLSAIPAFVVSGGLASLISFWRLSQLHKRLCKAASGPPERAPDLVHVTIEDDSRKGSKDRVQEEQPGNEANLLAASADTAPAASDEAAKAVVSEEPSDQVSDNPPAGNVTISVQKCDDVVVAAASAPTGHQKAPAVETLRPPSPSPGAGSSWPAAPTNVKVVAGSSSLPFKDRLDPYMESKPRTPRASIRRSVSEGTPDMPPPPRSKSPAAAGPLPAAAGPRDRAAWIMSARMQYTRPREFDRKRPQTSCHADERE